jgi:hypothetical protein
MKARILANVGCWLLVLPLVVAWILYGILVWHLWGTFTDLNAYTDPVAMILSYLTPIAALGTIGLAVLCRYGLAVKSHVVLAAVVSLCFSLAPFIFCVWLFHESNVHHYLSDMAWWMQPVNILWMSAYAMCLVTLSAGFVRKHSRFILAVLSTSLLLILGATLAWIFITNDFAPSLVNAFAVIPFAVACLSLIRMVFIWKENHAA